MSDEQHSQDNPENLPPVSNGFDPIAALLRLRVLDPPSHPGALAALGRYEVIGMIGVGGMGVVLLARDPVGPGKVAIKVLKPELVQKPEAVHRFLVEARHMQRLSHPSIVEVLEVSDRADGPYFVMPLMERHSLASLIRPGEPVDCALALRVARDVAEALQYAHSRGLVHRDLKPSNILLDRAGKAYLADFGLARTMTNDSFVDVRRSHCEGTAPYMSPAVAAGEAEDTRCDIYSFGALLYELLTGQPPYEGQTTEGVLRQILAGPPRPIRDLVPQARSGLVKISEGAMARELRDRYAEMADVIADLDRVANGKEPLGPHGKAAPARRHGHSIPVAIAASAIAVALLLWIFLPRPQPQPGPAPAQISKEKPSDGGPSPSNVKKDALGIPPAKSSEYNTLSSGGPIVFAGRRDGNPEIYTMEADGSNPVRLTNDPANDTMPTWSPDGTKIAFVSDRSGTKKIYVMNPDGSGVTAVPNTDLVSTESDQSRTVSWSPDGTRLAFVHDTHSIRTVNLDGSNLTVVVSGTISHGYDYYSAVDWGLGPNVLLLVAQQAFNGFNQDIFKYDLATSTVTHVTDDWGKATPSQGPAGKASLGKILFHRQGAGPPKNVFCMNSNGTDVAQVSSDTGSILNTAPRWSADGTQAVFTHNCIGRSVDVWRINLDGTAGIALTSDGVSFLPDWRLGSTSSYKGDTSSLANARPDSSTVPLVTTQGSTHAPAAPRPESRPSPVKSERTPTGLKVPMGFRAALGQPQNAT